MTKLDTLSTTLLHDGQRDEGLAGELPPYPRSSSLPHQHFIGESASQRLAQARASRYPLLHLAKPLLAVLSEVPARIEHAESVDVLRSWLIYEISLFAQLCEQLDIPWRKMTIARYCLCTALDEAIHTTEWGINSGWAQQNLLNYFEEDNDGGNKFFLLAGRLAMNPQEYAEVLLIMLHSLNLGFAGRYSIQQNGAEQLAQIRQQLYTLLLPFIPRSEVAIVTDYLSPPLVDVRKRLSLRGCSLLALFVVAATFGAYRLQLHLSLSQLTDQAAQFSQYLAVPPTSVETPTLPMLLKHDIDQGRLVIDNLEQGYRVKVIGGPMFASGSATLSTEYQAVIQRLAQAVKQLGGAVTLIGHSDSQPIRTQKKLSNQQLSLQRADNVAQLFYPFGFTDRQLKRVGVGEQQPLAPNSSLKQRNQNRRVEFIVTF
ncbi:OmpA family protein [Rosenbergiella australiborealis]|uniref:OmpA family protein n=1 Tax=Rosenbergiella australiborealis TaxID=1544696 RepID=A0ABS5T6P5_9GAMM|nr:type IVB secretion system protein IcmH/DotU [Rosenbergiella australiborealis]MBT0728017.1 OmpA family protein [Rosenbergiella australiborealis]